MGRKKGKQKGAHASKAERFYVQQQLHQTRLEAHSDEFPRYISTESMGERRPVFKPESLSNLKQLLSRPSAGSSLTDVASPHVASQSGPFNACTKLTWSPPNTLQQLCIDVIGKSLSSYDTESTGSFSCIPPSLLERLSVIASANGEINDCNVGLFMGYSEVEALCLHGSFSPAVLHNHLIMEGFDNDTPSGVKSEECQGSEESSVSDSGDDAWEALVADLGSWEVAKLGSQRAVWPMLTSISICAPDISGSFISVIASVLPSLETLKMLCANDNDRCASASLMTAIPSFTRLKNLDLSGCSWFCDSTLMDLIAALPVEIVEQFDLGQVDAGRDATVRDASLRDNASKDATPRDATSREATSKRLAMRHVLRKFCLYRTNVSQIGVENARSWITDPLVGHGPFESAPQVHDPDVLRQLQTGSLEWRSRLLLEAHHLSSW